MTWWKTEAGVARRYPLTALLSAGLLLGLVWKALGA